MTPQEFCYWLQGHLEMADPRVLDERQTEMIKRHLALVFTNVTADPVGSPETADDQAARRERVRKKLFDIAGPRGLDTHVFCYGTGGGRIC